MSENDKPMDSTTVEWPLDFTEALPATATYAAGVTRDPDMELRIIDLLYSVLDESYYRSARHEQLGIMATTKYRSKLFNDAQSKLKILSVAVIPHTVYANVIPGSDSGKPVYGIIAFYEKEEVTNGTVHE